MSRYRGVMSHESLKRSEEPMRPVQAMTREEYLAALAEHEVDRLPEPGRRLEVRR